MSIAGSPQKRVVFEISDITKTHYLDNLVCFVRSTAPTYNCFIGQPEIMLTKHFVSVSTIGESNYLQPIVDETLLARLQKQTMISSKRYWQTWVPAFSTIRIHTLHNT